MLVPYLSGRHVEAAVSPVGAVDAVRDAFVAYARGEWTMPPKVYVPAYPAGDFRAMPALGAGHALLKWVTSFPGNPQLGLPTVMGVVVLSDGSTGAPKAILDAAAVTALRTGAAAVLAAETLEAEAGATAAVVGAGINGRAVARTFVERGRRVMFWDVDAERAREAASSLGAEVAPSREAALAAAVVVTVTPGREILFAPGSLRPGQHVSLMGADGPGKAEIAPAELARVRVFCDCDQAGAEGTPDGEPRVRVFCDDWEQASKSGDLKGPVEAGLLGRDDVTELGDVLADPTPGRRHEADITIFDSTGLAIQDLAIALAALEYADRLDLPTIDL